jgi:hypothetical protein
VRDGEQRIRLANLAVQVRAPGARRALDDPACLDPRGGILLDRVAGFHAHLEDEFHWHRVKVKSEEVKGERVKPRAAPSLFPLHS